MTKTPQLPPTLEIPFAPVPGVFRKLKVRTPDEGTLAVWASTGARFQQLGDEWKATEAALAELPEDDPAHEAFRTQRSSQTTRGLSRALSIVKAALVEEADQDWVEDMLLGQQFDLSAALGILSATINELSKLKPQAAPTTGPAKKAKRV